MRTYTTAQVARLLGVGRDTLYRWMRSKKIRGGRVRRFGTVQLRFWTDPDLAEIRQYMKQHPYKSRGRKKGSKSRP